MGERILEENIKSLLLLSISIMEFNLHLTFHASLEKSGQLGRSLPLDDRGRGAPFKVEAKSIQSANDDQKGKGGTLAALPTDLLIEKGAGEGGFSSLYPPNKIHARCGLCDAQIPRYVGYRHASIGARRTVCPECQVKLGLPLRDKELYASLRD